MLFGCYSSVVLHVVGMVCWHGMLYGIAELVVSAMHTYIIHFVWFSHEAMSLRLQTLGMGNHVV
jgi:hypothetical protein